jgi:hypothetical protein
MKDVPERIRILRGETEERRYEFLQADLAMCTTFVDVATTEWKLGDRNASGQALERAEKGYSTIQELQSGLQREEYRMLIADKMGTLRDKLDHVRELLKKEPGDGGAETLFG